MSDQPFSTLVADAQSFYRALAKDNTKAFWEANKPSYDTALKAPALDLMADLSPPLSALSGTPVKAKLFRPHRDVRFSKDKTPYTTYLHMMWQLQSEAPQSPVFFFGIGQDYVTAGAGLMGFEKPMLENWRKLVDLDTDHIQSIVHDLTEAGYRFRDPALKRVPAPYAKDHPAADLLRMKGVVASAEINHTDGLPHAIMRSFQQLWPLNSFLLTVAEA